MNWDVLLPFLATLLQSLRGLMTPVPPTPIPTPVPTPTPTPTPVPVVQAPAVVPDQAIKDLQAMLNAILALNPPLVVDGWLGPTTDAAIEQGIAKLKAAGL